MTAILQTKALSKFSCLGDKCSDNCCQDVWIVEVDAVTEKRYREQAPELLDSLARAPTGYVFRKDKNHACVKLEGGMCGIQNKYGSSFLSDTCHFFPRSFLKTTEHMVVMAAPSCPEIIRLALESDEACLLEAGEMERMPLKHSELASSHALEVHQAFLNEAIRDKDADAESVYARIANAMRTLVVATLDDKTKIPAVKSALKAADARLPEPRIDPADPFNLFHALIGIVKKYGRYNSEYSMQLLKDMEKALGVTINWQTLHLHVDQSSQIAYQLARLHWRSQWKDAYKTALRRWLALQLSYSFYPYGVDTGDRIKGTTIIGIRLATVKLALMCATSERGEMLPPQEMVRVILSVSRILDHITDSDFSIKMCAEAGWDDEARMLGLLNA